MGRKRKSGAGLPERVYLSRGFYFYAQALPSGGAKWHRLGKEWDLGARLEWARITGEELTACRSGSFAELLDAYLAAMEKKAKDGAPDALKPRTIADSRDHATALKVIFGDMRPDDIKPTMIAQYLRRRKTATTARTVKTGKAGKAAPVRANREKATLSSCFSWAMGEGVAASNPAFGVRNNKESKRARAPELWEIRAVQKHLNEQWQAVVELALLVGQRGVDLRQLTRQDVDDKKGVLFVQTKRGAKVLVEWDPELRAVMDRLLAIRKNKVDSMLIIPSRHGAMYTPTGWGTMFYKGVQAAIAAGDLHESFVFHDLRAANATMEDEAGGSAQRRLGHTTEKQTADYVRGRRPTKVAPLKLAS